MFGRVAFGRVAVLLLLGACEGPVGPAGMNGTNGQPGENGQPGPAGEMGVAGDPGATGPQGPSGCDGLAPGQTRGLAGAVTVSSPANGMFFAVGEQATLTIVINDRCGKTYPPSELASAALYLHGPREGLLTTTACGLLNCVTNRSVTGHHRIDLAGPVYADPAQANLTTAADGTMTYVLAPIDAELPGTYTAAVFAKTKDDLDQLYIGAELQIGTVTRQEFATGPAPSAKCASCHKSPMSGKLYLHHSHPGRSAYGSFNYDSEPIETCLACHNGDGYSPNLLIAKAHLIHRGKNLKNPGAAHPEYGLGAQAGIADFTNVGFPRMPGGEKDCVACHADDRWQTRPSRMACGTCHDNVYFDTGTLSPPRAFTKTCSVDDDCLSLGSFTSCDTDSGLCVRAAHPTQADDTQCISCHGAEGFSPIADKHEIFQRTRDAGLVFTDVVMTKGTATTPPPAFFQAGDIPILTFKLQNAAGTFITLDDLKTSSIWSTTLTVAGPTDHPQQLYASSTNLVTKGTLTYDVDTHLFTYVLPSALPAGAVAPLNYAGATAWSRPNPAGTYTLWLWSGERQKVGTEEFRNVGSVVINFRFGADGSIKPRQVIAAQACDACHDNLQAHGGGRQEPGTCFTCHTAGAEDKIVGARGAACTQDSQCKGGLAGWEQCQDKDATKPGLDTCVIIQDPTPGATIHFPVMIHKIHFARLLDGYAELGNFLMPGKLQYTGYNNSPTGEELSDILLPQDIRSCQTCHTNAGGTCSSSKPCGFGQACVGGTCVNDAWLVPSTAVCLSCHDTEAAYGHAQLNTWSSGMSSVETCEVCHGESSQFSVKNVHNISNPYVPPYAREKE